MVGLEELELTYQFIALELGRLEQWAPAHRALAQNDKALDFYGRSAGMANKPKSIVATCKSEFFRRSANDEFTR